jgi:hypothetical protein
MPHRIETLRDSNWEYACPKHKHRNVRVVDGHFECRSCGEAIQEIVHLPSGEHLQRDDVEIIGPHADTKAAFDPREGA